VDEKSRSQESPQPRKPSLTVALVPLVLMGLLLGVGYGVYKIKPQILLVAAAFLTGGLGLVLRFSWKDMERGYRGQHPQGHARHPDHAHGRYPARLLERAMRSVTKVWTIVLTTIVTAITSALVTGSSYLSMIIPGELLSPIYKKKGLAAKNLSRIIEESGGVIVPLIPWSMAGVYITGTIGVSPLAYLPWAVMNYVSVIILMIYGLTGITMAPKVREDETQIGS